MSELKGALHVARVERRQRSEGLSIAQLHQQHLPDHLDPFLAFDHFHMAQPFFPPHPHAGFSAVTYMFADSQNGFINRDSRGDRSEIPPGALHWTAAGRGIVHEEVPKVRGVVCSGLQIFVNLHSSQKGMAPRAIHLDANEVPTMALPRGGTVRVVAGASNGLASPAELPTKVTLLDAYLRPGEAFEHEVAEGEDVFAYVIAGAGCVGPRASSTVVDAGDAIGFSRTGRSVRVEAESEAMHVVVAGGRPLREPVVFHGPFCMNTVSQIEAAIADYQSGRMGHLDPSF